ncbi:MAG: hypothetical protein Q9182_000350 [Xanthomendoza sp. 2 TL-2023]
MKDHFYICPGHLKDRGFCTPIVDEVEVAAKKKKEDLDREIELVKAEYAEKLKKRAKSKEKKKNEKSNQSAKDKAKADSKDDDSDDDEKLEKEKNDKIKAVTEQGSSTIGLFTKEGLIESEMRRLPRGIENVYKAQASFHLCPRVNLAE